MLSHHTTNSIFSLHCLFNKATYSSNLQFSNMHVMTTCSVFAFCSSSLPSGKEHLASEIAHKSNFSRASSKMNRNFYRMPNPPCVSPGKAMLISRNMSILSVYATVNGLIPPWIPNTSPFHHGYTHPPPYQNRR